MDTTLIDRLIGWAAKAGLWGALAFGGVLVVLSGLEYEFLRGLGWEPSTAAATAWPSGLALGPYGWVFMATLVLSGVLLIVFALGLHGAVNDGLGRPLGPALLVIAGIALMIHAFPIDPPGAASRSWHATIHTLAVVLLGLSLLPGIVVMAARFRDDPRWRNHDSYTIATGFVAVVAFVISGLGLYVFLAVVLGWFAVTGARLADERTTRLLPPDYEPPKPKIKNVESTEQRK